MFKLFNYGLGTILEKNDTCDKLFSSSLHCSRRWFAFSVCARTFQDDRASAFLFHLSDQLGTLEFVPGELSRSVRKCVHSLVSRHTHWPSLTKKHLSALAFGSYRTLATWRGFQAALSFKKPTFNEHLEKEEIRFPIFGEDETFV